MIGLSCGRARLVGALLVLGAGAARAQEVRGTVRDSAMGLPLSGAIAQLLDSTNHVVTRTLSDQDGKYRLSRTAEAVWLQVLRIGYRPRTRKLPTDLTSETFDIAMARLPQRLEPVVVTQNAKCPKRKDYGEAYALWEEARTGLLATVVAREARPATMRLAGFTRVMRARNSEVIDHQLVRLLDTAAASRSYVAVMGAPEFTRLGFMTEDSTGGRVYFAPDPDVLLDPDFMASHCFSIANGDREHPGQTGLSFEPASGGGRDTLVEVRGTLWLDRSAAALRTLEFRYANLEPATELVRPGGTESFLSVANGVTLIDHWEIRFPIVSGAVVNGVRHVISDKGSRDLYVHRPDNVHAWVSALYASGGQLVSAVWPDSFSWHAKLPMVVGRVVDPAGVPLRGVQVVADSTDYHAVSDVLGTFVIHDVLPGPYRWFATVPNLAPLGVRISPYESTDIDANDYSVRVKLTAHTGEDGRDFFCDAKQLPGTVAFVGRLLNADRTPGANLDIRIEWEGPTWANKDSLAVGMVRTVKHTIDVTTNSDGRFKMCGVPMQDSPLLPDAVHASRILIFSGRTRLLEGPFVLPSSDWIQGVTITLPARM